MIAPARGPATRTETASRDAPREQYVEIAWQANGTTPTRRTGRGGA